MDFKCSAKCISISKDDPVTFLQKCKLHNLHPLHITLNIPCLFSIEVNYVLNFKVLCNQNF